MNLSATAEIAGLRAQVETLLELYRLVRGCDVFPSLEASLMADDEHEVAATLSTLIDIAEMIDAHYNPDDAA